jgi:hypothetical protein
VVTQEKNTHRDGERRRALGLGVERAVRAVTAACAIAGRSTDTRTSVAIFPEAAAWSHAELCRHRGPDETGDHQGEGE